MKKACKDTGAETPDFFNVDITIDEIKQRNVRDLCQTSTTLETRWHSDYAKSFESRLVQIEAQFGKVEAMFKDFCGFRIAFAERRLALGIEIVLVIISTYNIKAFFYWTNNLLNNIKNMVATHRMHSGILWKKC